eukprot:m.86868 g.86868  ORF g.86868 m.86868 type:complete len:433 (+) comp36517_c0_seq3:45-1343(+)
MLPFPLLFLAVLSVCGGIPHPDYINKLPGDPGNPQIQQYSGYLEIGNGKHLHYWYVQSQISDRLPVVLWLSGGPGCSSMDAVLSQTGPYMISSDGKVLSLVNNTFGWFQFAHVLYLDSPIGVGFSFADKEVQTYNETEVVNDIYIGLQVFFQEYKENAEDALYIFAEGYASIEAVLLAEKIASNSSISLGGLLLEGGYLDEAKNENSFIDYAYYHGFISASLWDSLHKTCCKNGTCSYFRPDKGSLCQTNLETVRSFTDLLDNYDGIKSCKLPAHLQEEFSLSSLPCINQTAETLYFGNEDVKVALHIAIQAGNWTPCSENVSRHYKPYRTSISSNIRNLIQNSNIRIALVTGDVDMKFNILGIQWSIDALKMETTVAWRAWQYEDDVGGYVTEYARKLSVLTVKGAGHFIARSLPGPLAQLAAVFVEGHPF